MLNIDTIKNGLVIDHIKAGTGWRIFQWLGLDTSPFSAALIMNVVSRKSGLFSSWKATTDISIPIETARKMSTIPIRSVRIQIGLANMSYKNEDFDVPQKQSKKNVAVADRFLNHIGL